MCTFHIVDLIYNRLTFHRRCGTARFVLCQLISCFGMVVLVVTLFDMVIIVGIDGCVVVAGILLAARFLQWIFRWTWLFGCRWFRCDLLLWRRSFRWSVNWKLREKKIAFIWLRRPTFGWCNGQKKSTNDLLDAADDFSNDRLLIVLDKVSAKKMKRKARR